MGLLESRRLPLSEERRVTGLLRGVAGELADLVEAALPSGVSPEEEGPSQSKGEIQGRTPGPDSKAAVKEEQFSGSQYSYTEEDEEESKEEEVEVEAEPEGAKGETSEVKQEEVAKKKGETASGQAEEARAPASPRAVKEERPPYKLNPKFQRDYLTKRLQLFPTGKASAAPKKPGEEASHSGKRGPDPEAWMIR